MMNRIRILVLGILLVGIFALTTGCIVAKDQHLYTGNVEGVGIELAFESMGKIIDLPVEEGQAVTKDTTLAQLNTDSLQLKLETLILQTDKLENQRSLLLNRLSDQEVLALDGDKKAAENQLASLRKDYAVQQTKSAEYKVLFESGGISSDQYDDVVQVERKLRDQITTAQASVSALKNRVADKLQGPKAEELKAIDIDLQLLEVQKQEVELSLQKTNLMAPIDGTVEVKYAEEGEFVGAGTPIVRLINTEALKMTLYVPETELSRISRNQKVYFTDAILNTDSYGEIIFISPVAEFTPKNVESTESKHELVYRIVLKITDPTGQIKPGMFLTAVMGDANE